MADAVAEYERWLRREFVDCNTTLDEAYFAADVDRIAGDPALEAVKGRLVSEGGRLAGAIASHGSSVLDRYLLLGAVGFYLGACARHDVLSLVPSAVPALATRLGLSLGVAPRYVFAHQSTHNPAVDGAYRRFTDLDDENLFTTTNALAVVAYQRAAVALRRVAVVGVSSPITTYLLKEALNGLEDVLAANRVLGKSLDARRFHLNIRPYFMTHAVGAVEYRGVNAGDFAGVNEIDLQLGLVDAADPFYQRVMAEKAPFVPPEDQVLLREAVTAVPLLGQFLAEAERGVGAPLRENAGLYLAVCRMHGAAYAHHHSRLVKHFVEDQAGPDEGASASGPPLSAVVAILARLRDLRTARPTADNTARPQLERLRVLVDGL